MEMGYEILKNITSCQLLPTLLLGNKSLDEITVGVHSSLEAWQLVIIMLGIGVFGIVIAKTFNFIRKNVYKDKVRCLLMAMSPKDIQYQLFGVSILSTLRSQEDLTDINISLIHCTRYGHNKKWCVWN